MCVNNLNLRTGRYSGDYVKENEGKNEAPQHGTHNDSRWRLICTGSYTGRGTPRERREQRKQHRLLNLV